MKDNLTLNPSRFTLTLGWLYPELMSTYGDRGNIIVLQKRCEWRGIQVEIKKLEIGYKVAELQKCDLLFMGGAQDKEQKIVSDDLSKKTKVLKEIIDNGTPGLYICGAYQFLGKYYKEADGTKIAGLGIFDLYTENPGPNHPRLIGNILIQCHSERSEESQKVRSFVSTQDDKEKTLVGFENHGGRTYLGKELKPLGTVKVGFGNNGTDGTEGAVYKNSFGSYLHGPILPKNPHFADMLIKLALEKKYLPANATHQALRAGGDKITLEPLDDSLEFQAHEAIVKHLEIKV